MMDDHKMLAIIPALNEEHNIGTVVKKIKNTLPGVFVLVINDGSCDATARQARAHGAEVINLAYTLGIGAAVQTGLMFARFHGFDIAVQVDGDGQHDPSYIRRLVEPILKHKADMVIGSRYLEKKGDLSSLQRRIGIRIFSLLISRIMAQPITDPTSGFRAMNRRAIELFSDVYPDDYPEPESLVISHLRRLTVREVPVAMIRREFGLSSIGGVDAMYYMIKVILAIMIDLCKQGYRARTEEA